jgi:hypothetical protein
MDKRRVTRVPADPTLVSLKEGWEVCYWTSQLDASEEELLAAMRQVGPNVDAIRGYFRAQYRLADEQRRSSTGAL